MPTERDPRVPDKRYNKAGDPTTQEIAEAIERLRDLLFREYGTDFSFSVHGKDQLLAATYLDTTIHACMRGPEKRVPK